MPATSVLRARDRSTYCYLLVIDGSPVAFATNRELAGTAYLGGGRRVVAGLHWPRWRLGVRYLEDGQFDRNTTTFQFIDIAGDVANTFRDLAADSEPLEFGLMPYDDPDAAPLSGAANGRQIGPEAIGPSGQRGYWPCIPGFNFAQLHPGIDEALESEFSDTPVSDDPMILRGRRCALYRVFKDDDGDWRPWAESDRVWWGSVRTATSVDGRSWSIECDGPESWVYRKIGMLAQIEPGHVSTPLQLDTSDGNDESRIGIWLSGWQSSDLSNFESYGSDVFASQVTGDDTSSIRGDVATAIAAARVAVGTNGAFTAAYDQHVSLNAFTGAISIKISGNASPSRFAKMFLALHERVWARMGFDVNEPAQPHGDEMINAPLYPWPGPTGLNVEPPGPGYYIGIIATYDIFDASLQHFEYDNGGNPKIWKPMYPGGINVFDPKTGPAPLQFSEVEVSHPGQLDRPPASDPDSPSDPLVQLGGVTEVDRQGIWILRGKRRFVGQDEPIDEVQVVRASWKGKAQRLAQVAEVSGAAISAPTITVTGVLDPRWYGFDRPPMASAWMTLESAGDDELMLTALPAFHLGYKSSKGQKQIDVIALRLLLSTGLQENGVGGTTGWTSYNSDPAATLQATSNEPVFAPNVRLDGEHADLGLGIPSSMVDHIGWLLEGEQLEEDMREQSFLVMPGQETEAIWRAIMGPVNWAWSLEGGKYGVVSMVQTPVPEDGDVVVTYKQKATSPRDVSRHKTPAERTTVPIDHLQLHSNWNPIDQEFKETTRIKSPDQGARYRHDTGGKGSEHVVDAIGIHPHGVGVSPGISEWKTHAREIARYRAKEHVTLRRVPLMRRTAQDLWPGSRVILTEPRMPKPGGGYGAVGAVALVSAVEVDEGGHDGDGAGTFTVDLIVHRESIDGTRVHAPSAKGRKDQAIGHWWDSSANRIYIEDDWLDVGGGWNDTRGFFPPSWQDLGGSAKIYVRQWNGASWSTTGEARVIGINAEAGNSYLTVDSAVMTFARRDDEVVITLAPRQEQDAAWVLALYSPICDKDGLDGGLEKGFPWH